MRVGANPTVAQAGDQYRQPTQVQVVGKSSVSAPDRLDLKIAAFLRRYGGLRSEGIDTNYTGNKRILCEKHTRIMV